MSIVRYVNKKTGVVALYESTSHYDPVTQQSRPIRKYLGTEDPETVELIPSTGKRGRKRNDEKSGDPETGKKGKKVEPYKERYDKLATEFAEQAKRIKHLEHENKRLKLSLIKLRDTISEIVEAE